ncbi:DUF4192 domain-containing protein [Mycobacterium asiaticum]|uniref:DUF4192 domain-containing protein n=1 Tax=Mycobacterium asiaticum TaxID=1790 RepID=A0A1A3KNZ2_MYCAS|nr:DUF4192 domain-containing protein [Mycobacterium asiaticum]OBJ86078.1 hypothetical protein A5640_11250 [Mycobacterium asiaticum]
MSHSKINLSDPADLIAAAPGLLGFAPTNSIVAYMLRNDPTHGVLVRCAIRFDVTVTVEQATQFPRTCNLRPTDNFAAILIAVCDQEHDIHARHILNAVKDALHDTGIAVLRRFHARDVTEPSWWLDPDTGEDGDTYPYTDAVLTAELIHTGTPIYASRSELESEFSHLPPAAPVDITDPEELIRTTTAEITDALAGQPISSPTLATRAGILITADVAHRDAMLGLAAQTDPHAGAQLWTHIGRQLRGRPRTEALAVAAGCCLLALETVRAGVALDAAVEEAQRTHTPVPRLAGLLSAALTSGLDPQTIRDTLIKATGITGSGG